MLRGAKIIFLQVVEVSKKGLHKKKCIFGFRLFYVGTSQREKMKKMEKVNFKKCPENCVFGWL